MKEAEKVIPKNSDVIVCDVLFGVIYKKVLFDTKTRAITVIENKG